MKKVLYLGSMGIKSNRIDGVTIKSRCLRDHLLKQKIKLRFIDVDNYKKRFFPIIFNFIRLYFRSDKIVICASPIGAYMLLKFLHFLKAKKEIYYFVAGGTLAHNIEAGKYNLNVYKKISKIYVQSPKMQKELIDCGLENVYYLANFRNVTKFKNKYKKTSRIKFVFYGRVIKEKGIEQAIELIKKLNSKKIVCSLDIYGQVSDSYLEELKKMFTSRINYKGVLVPNGKDEYETLTMYDILLFPTEWSGEGLPGSIIDSYFAGLGVIASNWEYAKECIRDNVNGVIFEYKNYDDMYNKTLDVIKNNKIDSFKKESLKLSKNYYAENVLSDFINDIMH